MVATRAGQESRKMVCNPQDLEVYIIVLCFVIGCVCTLVGKSQVSRVAIMGHPKVVYCSRESTRRTGMPRCELRVRK